MLKKIFRKESFRCWKCHVNQTDFHHIWGSCPCSDLLDTSCTGSLLTKSGIWQIFDTLPFLLELSGIQQIQGTSKILLQKPLVAANVVWVYNWETILESLVKFQDNTDMKKKTEKGCGLGVSMELAGELSSFILY